MEIKQKQHCNGFIQSLSTQKRADTTKCSVRFASDTVGGRFLYYADKEKQKECQHMSDEVMSKLAVFTEKKATSVYANTKAHNEFTFLLRLTCRNIFSRHTAKIFKSHSCDV